MRRITAIPPAHAKHQNTASFYFFIISQIRGLFHRGHPVPLILSYPRHCPSPALHKQFVPLQRGNLCCGAALCQKKPDAVHFDPRSFLYVIFAVLCYNKTIMTRIFEYTIEKNWDGSTALAYLTQKGYSRHLISRIKLTPDGLLQNGGYIFTNQILQAGDRLRVTLPDDTPSANIIPVPLPFDVLFEDEDLAVVNKPADMPIHPSLHNFDNTLANAAAFYYASKGEPFVFRCINRLDRDTTGLLILAKNPLSGCILSDMMLHRRIQREYLGIARGMTGEGGTISAPIRRMESSAIARCVDYEHGDPAVTHYRRLAFQNGCSLLSLRLETGRTHQIRVHLLHLGHPLLGDFLYYPDRSRIRRQALHSHRLDFSHPVTGKPLSFVCPMPEDMRRCLALSL